MDLQLKGKKAFVSGSASGIGLAVVHKLLDEGCEVILNGRTQASVDRALQVLENHPGLSGIAADLSNKADMDRLIGQLDLIDILINNAGIFTSQPFTATPDEDWYRMFEVNVMAGMRLSRALLPGMLSRNEGRIVFISSECAQLVPADLIAYSSTKAALHALSRGLAQLTKGSRVTVNTVMPGSTLTEGAEKFLGEQARAQGKDVDEVSRDFFTNERTSSLMQRFATPEEIATAVVYLASQQASATNGAVLRTDGGSVGGIF